MTGRPKFRKPSVTDPLKAIDASITQERATIREIEQALSEHKRHLSRLESSRRTLVNARAPRVPKEPVVKTAAQRAGKANVEAARTVLSGARQMAKAEIGRQMAKVRGVAEVNDGTVTYAIRALEEERVARRTGEREHGSDVYEYVSPQRAISRPRR